MKDTDQGIVRLNRQIRGSESIFNGKKLVILEGGYDWFLKLKSKYPNIAVAFIAPFSENELAMRTRNTEWIESKFTDPLLVRLAYEEMNRLIIENKGEIDIVNNEAYQEEIVNIVVSEVEIQCIQEWEAWGMSVLIYQLH
ncbi:MAG: hypothetical protein HZC11_06540 [Nitrospirae bacterium]|nr:hypothetical protein [Nitrospirota bacterium]